MKKDLYAGGMIILVILLAFLLKINYIDCLVTMIAFWVLLGRLEKEDKK